MKLKVCNSEDYIEEKEENINIEYENIDGNERFACVMSMMIMFVFAIGIFFML